MVGLTLRNADRNTPWSTMGSWTKEFDQLFKEMDRILVPFRYATSEYASTGLPCDIHESDASYLLTLDLPGVSKDDINIEFTGNCITVSAEKKQESTVTELTSHRQERLYGSLKRTFTLPEGIDTEKIQANYENGVLYLSIPKAELTKSKKIEIGAGKNGFLKSLASKATELSKSKTANA